MVCASRTALDEGLSVNGWKIVAGLALLVVGLILAAMAVNLARFQGAGSGFCRAVTITSFLLMVISLWLIKVGLFG